MMRRQIIRQLQNRRIESARLTLRVPRKDLSFPTELLHKVAESFVDHTVTFQLGPRLPLIGSPYKLVGYSGFFDEIYGYALHSDAFGLRFSILLCDSFIRNDLAEYPLWSIPPALLSAPIDKGPGPTEAAIKLLALLDAVYVSPSKPRALGTLMSSLKRHRKDFSLFLTRDGGVALHGQTLLGSIAGFPRELSLEAEAHHRLMTF